MHAHPPARQSLDSPPDALCKAGVTRIFSEKTSTRATQRPELDKAVALAGALRASGVRVTLVVHEHKRLGRGIELATRAEELKASGLRLELPTGALHGAHAPSGVASTAPAAWSGREREYIRERALEGHESARKRGKTIGGAGVTDDDMLSTALHLRDQELSLRDITSRLAITTCKKMGQHPSPATVMGMLRKHDEQTPAASAAQPSHTTAAPERCAGLHTAWPQRHESRAM
ncbi:hypothetical protein GCM10010211_34090 [Streptomyces albospinus]|uniref:Resolvase/invertase-type recombinase catalytic domain-containing protein n=1 Tax=Streptomyces albospinus TaxID=285515 RepID=A0ABQ2V2K8_9ACTN|nr:recombinase family protein [Streptomyces albospinus]GGU66042.1 hypothetical protein GCM10010211_34090 [Streptomyces albospinus]